MRTKTWEKILFGILIVAVLGGFVWILIPLAIKIVYPTGAIGSPSVADSCHINDVSYCVLNPSVTQSTISSTICVSGWTATVRPPVSYTNAIKSEKLAAKENLVNGDTNISHYELDHRMPLELGGSPKDIHNLSLEYGIPNPKDSEENSLKRSVCNGTMTLAQAQQKLVKDWLKAYPGYVA